MVTAVAAGGCREPAANRWATRAPAHLPTSLIAVYPEGVCANTPRNCGPQAPRSSERTTVGRTRSGAAQRSSPRRGLAAEGTQSPHFQGV